MQQMEDAAMLTALKGGDIKAYQYFFMKYYRPLCLKARVMLHGIQESEQLVQHIFIQVWEEKLYMNIEHSVGGFFYKMVHISCMNLVKGGQSTGEFSSDQGLLMMQQVVLPLPGYLAEYRRQVALEHRGAFSLSLWSEENRNPLDFSRIFEKGVKIVKHVLKSALRAIRLQTRTRL